MARPKEPSPNELWIGSNKNQGLSVISCKGGALRIAADYDPNLKLAVPVEVVGDESFQVLAVWMLKEPIHYVPNLVAILEHYRPFLERGPTIIAGDFNANPTFDRSHRRYLFSSVTAKLEELGFCSAYHTSTGELHGKETQATHYFRYHREEPFHIDYLFFPRAWRSRLGKMSVGNFDDFSGLSDHRPLSAEFLPSK